MDERVKKIKYPPQKKLQNVNNRPIISAHPPSDTSKDSDLFYEMDYAFVSAPKACAYVRAAQKIEYRSSSEIKLRFEKMHNIARVYRTNRNLKRHYDLRVRGEKSEIFYRQAMFMKDFIDDYERVVPFSGYFPFYEVMGYEQLRTYFTFRTKARKGDVCDTCLSYAFLYVYELLSNIGTASKEDALEKLMGFYKDYSRYNDGLDKYIFKWIKDYHIYYCLSHTFEEFVEKNGISNKYPKKLTPEDGFEFFYKISKYDIKKSKFYTPNTEKLINDCFCYVIDSIKQSFEETDILFDDMLFCPIRDQSLWMPFKNALFYDWYKQPDRKEIFCEDEIYILKNNRWGFSTTITTAKGKQFIGFVMRQMESCLRRLTGYKYNIAASTGMINGETVRVLLKAGLAIDEIVENAVARFYRELTKTVVTVDHKALEKIRIEALDTQNALIIDEKPHEIVCHVESVSEEPVKVSDRSEFGEALSDNEIKALGVLLEDGDIKAFADNCGEMLEVLIDGINEKAMDFIGDNLMDEDFVLYDDYKEQVKELIK